MSRPLVFCHGVRHRRLFVCLMAILGFASIGCQGPLAAERDAFAQWQQIDAARHVQSAPPRSDQATAPAPAGLPGYLEQAMLHNPGLQAAFDRWKAALHRVPQARALMDPQLDYSYFVRQSMTRQTVSLSQMLPWFGKLEARGNVAVEQALAAGREFEARLHQVRARVRTAYIEYAYLASAIQVMRRHEAILVDLHAAAQARLQAGQVSYADVSRAMLAVEQMRDAIASQQARRTPVMAQLNAAVGWSPDRQLPWPDPVEQITLGDLALQQTDLAARLLRDNPQLAALQHQTASERHRITVARQARLPDVMLGVEYMDMTMLDDQVALMGSINLPIWFERLEAQQAEALARFSAATRDQLEQQHALTSDLHAAWFRYEDAQRRAALFASTLIPQAQDTLQAAQAAYAADQVAFEALAQAQVALQELELTRQRVLADQRIAQTQIQQLLAID